MGQTPPKYQSWLHEHAFPMWMGAGFDEAQGCFQEALTFAGTPSSKGFHRTRVQARQIFAATQAHLEGADERALDRAESALDFVTKNGWADGFVHKLGGDGRVINATIDTYDQAFMLYALAWWWKVSKDQVALDWVTRTLDVLDKRLGAPNAGYLESDPTALPRRQNPHMHLLEALLALHQFTGESAFLERAKGMVNLFNDHLFDRNNNSLYEFFEDDWAPNLLGDNAYIEPGHHAEWVYLLHAYETASGEDQTARIDALYQVAVKAGRVPGKAFCFDGIHWQSHAPKPTIRLWGQTELLRAHKVMQIRKPDQAQALAAEEAALMTALFETYFNTDVPGLWYDQYEVSQGALVSTDVPASSFYHILTALQFGRTY
ncbi:MAG: AGE family epimerase/isomerase [Alphaproteobacteria bacterium]